MTVDVYLYRRKIPVRYCLTRFSSILSCMRKTILAYNLPQLCQMFLILWLVMHSYGTVM